jgi:hypothetical protein
MPHFSFAIFLSLLAIILASGGIFVVLTRRWTTDRRTSALRDWAAEERFTMRVAPRAELPPALESLASLSPRVEIALTRGPIEVLKLVTISQPNSRESRWHVLIRQLDRAWSPAGLRPVGRGESFIDLFAMNGFPSLLTPDRFVAYGVDARAAKQIAHSPARGLLPPDVGLMVHGPYVTLDFSPRPFDTIEFERMLVVMEQIVSHTPAQAEAPASSPLRL